jgi:putative transposase
VEVVKELRQMLLLRALRIGLLYLDKGFSGFPVLNYLRRSKQPSLIACPIRGKKGGTRALCRGRASYRTDCHLPKLLGCYTSIFYKASNVHRWQI